MYQDPSLMLFCDGYKLSHRLQYPVGSEFVDDNFTARGSRVPGQEFTIEFGLQYFLCHYFQEVASRTFFERDVDEVCNEYQQLIDSYIGPDNDGVQHIRDLWELGYFPLEFWAAPEGTKVPLRVPMFTVRNTLPEFFWLPNYFETLLSSVLWLPITSATTSWRYRQLLNEACEAQGTDPSFTQWQGHDFSFRGMASPEAAALSGAGHLLSFTGTDSIPAIKLLEKYYRGTGLIGGSVPATEHSVMCAGGKDTEAQTFNRLLDIHPGGILSVVSDTWDIWNVILNIVAAMKDRILGRNGKLVIRPDSGDPVKIICGDPDATPGSPEYFGVVELLWQIFGGTTTAEGYRLLDEHIGVIYGDAITEARCREIIQRLAAKRFASANVVYGIGSFTFQYVTRDTYGMAMKATWAQIKGEEHFLAKDPITDDGLKRSATGLIMAYNTPQGITMRDGLSLGEWHEATEDDNALYQCVWRNGSFQVVHSLEEIRARVAA